MALGVVVLLKLEERREKILYFGNPIAKKERKNFEFWQ